MSKRASLHTLGCRLNQSETAIIVERLKEAGYTIVSFGEPADLGIINTCTVTGEADAKSRKMIRSFVRKNPEAFTTVIGCYSELAHAAIAEIEGVDLIIGNTEKLNILDYAAQGKNSTPVIINEEVSSEDFTIDIAGSTDFSRRANLKIQEGCDFMCSYCIVPFARGSSRSRVMENLVDEARVLAGRGAKEIVLTGINLGTYDYEGKNIADVADALNEIEGIERIRISSIDLTTIPENLLDMMNDKGHALVPFLHIPLQSGSNGVLKKMNRKYMREEFIEFIKRADSEVEDICIGTDVLVGFPGETDDDIEETCDLLREGPIAYAHVFKYSEREGSRAAKFPDKVDPRVMNLRSARVRKISAEKTHAFEEQFLNRVLGVLFESKQDDQWLGYTANYIRVAVSSDEELLNTIRPVKLERVIGEIMQGCLDVF